MSNLSKRFKVQFFIIMSILLLIILKNAWISDDAYITFRVIDNFYNGYGLRWNVAERVQAYTNPLWLIVISLIHFITSDFYYTAIFTSIVLTLISYKILALKISRNANNILIVSTLLIFSNSFIDYSTSGLENALSYLLISIFMVLYLSEKSDKKTFFFLSLTAGLITLNRFDGIILVFPMLIHSFIRQAKHPDRSRPFFETLMIFVAGFSPLLLWIIFSLIYYGFPFPNSAYAKLNTGLDRLLILRQGKTYFIDFFKNDIAGTIALFFTVIASIFFRKKYGQIIILSGLFINFFYVLWISGDFMSGRFFSTTVLMSAIVLSRYNPGLKFTVFACLTVVILSVTMARNPVFSFKREPETTISNYVADEKRYYFPYTGLFNSKPFSEKPIVPFAKRGTFDGNLVIKFGTGISGYDLGPEYFIVDRYALSDPLLARIPFERPWEKARRFRPGHLNRDLPAGYVETLKSDENLILNPDLKLFYDKLTTITRGNIFRLKRFKEILKMNLGFYNYLIRNYSLQKTFVATTKRSDYKNLPEHKDPESSLGVARIGDNSLEYGKFLVYGPYITLRPGKYRIDYRMKIQDVYSDGRVAVLDVISRVNAYATKFISVKDFKKTGEYKTFSLYIEISYLENNVEFRVNYRGGAKLFVDTIIMTKLHDEFELPERRSTPYRTGDENIAVKDVIVQKRTYSAVNADGNYDVYPEHPGVLLKWKGIHNRHRYTIKWISPQGESVFVKSIRGESRKKETWYPYLGKMPLEKGLWKIKVFKNKYRTPSNDVFVKEVPLKM